MRITCNQKQLDKALSIVSRAVPSRHTLPVLSNIYIGTEGGRLKLAATNLEVGITVWVDAQVEEPGSITLPARLWGDLVRQSPPERITMRQEGKSDMRYDCGPVHSLIKGIDAQEFPIVPAASEGDRFALPANLLREMIEQVTFAAATDDSRPILTGSLMAFEPHRLTMCSTDGFRLSLRHAPLDESREAEGGSVRIIAPASVLAELARIIGDSEEMVQVTITPNRNQMLVSLGDVVLMTQLIEGNFPDVQRLIPTEHKTTITIDAPTLLKTVRRCQIFSKDESQVTRLRFTPAEEAGAPGKLVVHGAGTEIGENEEELPAAIDGIADEIAINAIYLVKALDAFGPGPIMIETSGATRPALLHAPNSSDFQHVLMPMHINPQR